jgi:hypothetical protein
MNRPREIAQIEAMLGCTFTARELGPYVAFQSAIAQDASMERDKAMKVVEQHCLSWHAVGYTVFLGYTDFEGDSVLPSRTRIRCS